MPNHVKNIVKIISDNDYETKQILEKIKIDNENVEMNSLDFNKIIPMPESLNIEAGTNTDLALNLYLTSLDPNVSYFGTKEEKLSKEEFEKAVSITNGSFFSKTKYYKPVEEDKLQAMKEENAEDKLLSTGKNAFENIEKYGCSTWYTWARKNWGTKWNAYDFEKGNDSEIEFHTAWTPPVPVIKELSRQNPDSSFELSYTDEGLGYDTGIIVFKAGIITFNQQFEDFSKEAYENSMRLYHTDPEFEGLYPSFDGKTYIGDYTEYDTCYIKGELCLYSEFKHSPSQIPGGFFTYFHEGNTLSSLHHDSSAGIVLSKKPFDLDKDGNITFENGDIIINEDKISLESFSIHEENILSNRYENNIDMTFF